MKKVVNLSIFDYAGAGSRYSNAVNRVGKYSSTSIKLSPHRFGYSSDVTLYLGTNARPDFIPKRKQKIRNLIDEADVIHLVGADSVEHWNNKEVWNKAYPRIIGGWPEIIIPTSKPIVITAVGSFFRRHLGPPDKDTNWARDPIEMVARHTNVRTVDTPDLNYPEFKSEWLPLPHDSRKCDNYWLKKDHTIPIIGHSPSSRSRKGTDTVFLPALEIVKNKGYKFEVDIIENVTHEECLNRKQNLSLFFGQVGIGWYANSLIEACMYGIPSLCWLEKSVFSQIEEKDRNIPIISFDKSPELLAEAIINFLNSDMKKKSIETKNWADNFHSYESVGERLSDLYDRAFITEKV